MRRKRVMLSLILAIALISSSCQSTTQPSGGELSEETLEETKEMSETEEIKTEETDTTKETKEPEETDTTVVENFPEGILGIPLMSEKDYPQTDGSTATIPLSQALYRLSTGASQDEAEGTVVHSKTTNAYLGLINGVNDLVIAYEPADSVHEAEKEMNVELDIRPIGKDALVFLTNEGNPVQSLSQQQLVDIYSGKITRWSEAGGRNKEIAAFQRPDGSGSQTLMKKLVMKDTEMADAPVELISTEMGDLIEDLAEYNNEENALGYSVYYYAHNMYHMPGLRLMGVDQVAPDNNSIRNGTYPYVNEFYAAVRRDEPEDSNAYRLFKWLTSDGGQVFVESMGYVACRDVKETVELFPEDSAGQKKTLDLGENQRIVVDKSLFGNENGSIVIDKNLNYVNQETSYKYNNAVILELNQLVPVTDAGTYKMGVKKFGADQWIIPPEYSYVEEWNDLYRCAMIYDIETYEETFFDRTGKKVFSDEKRKIEHNDDYIWTVEENLSNVEIYDEKLNLVRTIDFTQYGTPRYIQYSGLTGKIDFVEGYFVMWNMDGDDIFDSREIPEEIWENQLKSVTQDTYFRTTTITQYEAGVLGKKWISFHNGDEKVIYDREKKKVTAGIENEVRYDDWGKYYTAKSDGKVSVYDTNGNVMKSADGTPYSLAAGNGYFGYLKDGKMVMEKKESGEKYELEGEFDTDYVAKAITDHTFLIQSDSYEVETTEEDDRNDYLFSGNKKLAEREKLYSSQSENMHIVSESDGDYKIVLDDMGKILYVSSEKEYIHLATPSTVVVTRGNYLCILNSQGECVLKFLFKYMGDD